MFALLMQVMMIGPIVAPPLMGTLQYLIAAVLGLAASLVPAGPAQVPAVIGACGLLTLLVCAGTRRRAGVPAAT